MIQRYHTKSTYMDDHGGFVKYSDHLKSLEPVAWEFERTWDEDGLKKGYIIIKDPK